MVAKGVTKGRRAAIFVKEGCIVYSQVANLVKLSEEVISPAHAILLARRPAHLALPSSQTLRPTPI